MKGEVKEEALPRSNKRATKGRVMVLVSCKKSDCVVVEFFDTRIFRKKISDDSFD